MIYLQTICIFIYKLYILNNLMYFIKNENNIIYLLSVYPRLDHLTLSHYLHKFNDRSVFKNIGLGNTSFSFWIRN